MWFVYSWSSASEMYTVVYIRRITGPVGPDRSLKTLTRRPRAVRALAVALLVVLPLALAGCTRPDDPPAPPETPAYPKHPLRFDGTDAFTFVEKQVIGPDGKVQYRIPGTPGNARVAQFIENELATRGAKTEFQSWGAEYACKNTPLRNVVGTFPGATNRTIVLLAHYDTRPVADKDPVLANRGKPVPGANDGGSGVAVLLELADALRGRVKNLTVIYAFVDAEDGGDLPRDPYDCSTGWIMGSLQFMSRYNRTVAKTTEGIIVVDMVGDTDLVLRKEGYSAKGPGRLFQDYIWKTGQRLGYTSVFLDDVCCDITDDHRAFLDPPAVSRFGRPLPAVDIIHLDADADVFPSTHHTVDDDLEHVSAESLAIVGRTLEHVLLDLDRVASPLELS